MVFLINLIKLFIRTKVIFPKIVGNIFTNELFYFIVLLALISVTPAIFIYQRLIKLYPAVEIQTRKEFDQSEKEKRLKLWVIISLIIVPTILSFVFRLV
jgi:ribosomal protein S19